MLSKESKEGINVINEGMKFKLEAVVTQHADYVFEEHAKTCYC